MDILVVDDDAFIRKLIGIHLKKEGYVAQFASDGLEALALLTEHHFDLAIVDVMMPKMDGITATARLREESNIPVIMLTAKGETDDKVTGLKSGADDYITKPFEMKEVLARIEAVSYTHLRAHET